MCAKKIFNSENMFSLLTCLAGWKIRLMASECCGSRAEKPLNINSIKCANEELDKHERFACRFINFDLGLHPS